MAVVAYLKKKYGLMSKDITKKIYYQDDYDFWLKIIKKFSDKSLQQSLVYLQ